MNNPDQYRAHTIPVGARRDIDRICDDFERAWQSGGQPRLEDFLPELPEPAHSELTRQLLEVEIEQRASRGDVPPFPQYVKRFPALAAWLRNVLREGNDNVTPAPGETEVKGSGGRQQPTADVAGSIVGRAFGQYAVIERVGAGGMGAVYRVRHTMIHCERALKVLKPGLARNAQAVKRFLIEAQASIGLTHPNVVATYDVGQDNEGTVYLVMELLDGQNLDELVRAVGPLDFSLAAEITRQAAAGLESAHRYGAVHRDVKPHNIMWTRAKTAKILDLGLARIMDDPTEGAGAAAGAGDRPSNALLSRYVSRLTSRYESRLTDGKTLLGTLAYISPEQAADARQADAQSDLYSLGCTLYYLLTGRHAFTGRSPTEILDKHVAGDYEPIALRRPDVPPTLDAIAARMMHKNRARRFASAGDVQKALQSWLSPRAARTVPFNIDDPESMRHALTSLRIISEDDWNTARIKAQRATASQEAGPFLPVPEMFARPNELSPGMMILLQLWRLHHEPRGENLGLSEFQIRHLLNGHIDLLRLPQHVLLDQIGSGWKGEIFKARSLENDRFEAVRTFAPRMLEGLPGEGKERIPAFVAAVEKLQKLSHPSLAKIHSAGAHENRLHGELAYLTMEFFDGETLAKRVANDPKVGTSSSDGSWGANVVRGVSRFFKRSRRTADGKWAASVIREVCRGLEYAHEEGKLHLDIHAGAIIIDRADRPLLLDLGVAHLMTPGATKTELLDSAETLTQGLTMQGTDELSRDARLSRPRGRTTFLPPPPIGTPEIMPPEQWRDREDVSPATDIYNLGCTLFFAITGEYPFAGESAMELMQKHLHSAPLESPAARDLPHYLRPVLEKCLAKAPRDRFNWSVRKLGTGAG